MTITLGWNLIPIAITLCGIVVVIVAAREDRGGYMSGLGCMLWALFIGFTIASVWLIFVLLTGCKGIFA